MTIWYKPYGIKYLKTKKGEEKETIWVQKKKKKQIQNLKDSKLGEKTDEKDTIQASETKWLKAQ